MPTIRLQNMLVESLTGPADDLRFYRTVRARDQTDGPFYDPGDVVVPIPPRQPPAFDVEGERALANFLPFQQGINKPPRFPNGFHPECKVWKVADAFYSFNQDYLRHLYRPLITNRQISTYDAFMMQAVPCLLRGLDKTCRPLPTFSWSLKTLDHPHDVLPNTPDWLPYVGPPFQSDLRGLYYATFRLYRTFYVGPDPDPGPGPPVNVSFPLDYFAELWCEGFQFWQDPKHAGQLIWRLFSDGGPGHPNIIRGPIEPPQENRIYLRMSSPYTRAWLLFKPAKHDVFGRALGTLEPRSKWVYVKYLTPDNTFTHWPQDLKRPRGWCQNATLPLRGSIKDNELPLTYPPYDPEFCMIFPWETKRVSEFP